MTPFCAFPRLIQMSSAKCHLHGRGEQLVSKVVGPPPVTPLGVYSN